MIVVMWLRDASNAYASPLVNEIEWYTCIWICACKHPGVDRDYKLEPSPSLENAWKNVKMKGASTSPGWLYRYMAWSTMVEIDWCYHRARCFTLTMMVSWVQRTFGFHDDEWFCFIIFMIMNYWACISPKSKWFYGRSHAPVDTWFILEYICREGFRPLHLMQGTFHERRQDINAHMFWKSRSILLRAIIVEWCSCLSVNGVIPFFKTEMAYYW